MTQELVMIPRADYGLGLGLGLGLGVGLGLVIELWLGLGLYLGQSSECTAVGSLQWGQGPILGLGLEL